MLYLLNLTTALTDDWHTLPWRDAVLLELMTDQHAQVGIILDQPDATAEHIEAAIRTLGVPRQHIVINPTGLHRRRDDTLYVWQRMPEQAAGPWSRPDLAERALPAPAMLFEAMAWFNARPAGTVYVGAGDRDEQTARNAACAFAFAEDFFQRPLAHDAPEPFP
jgi:hypothetical protein